MEATARILGPGAARPCDTVRTVLRTKRHHDARPLALAIHVGGPPGSARARGTGDHLSIPVHGNLVDGLGALDLRLPAGTRTRRAAPDEPVFRAAVDAQLGRERGRIAQGLPWGHVLVNERLLNGGCALGLMDGCRRRVHVREQVRGGRVAGRTDVAPLTRPLRVALVAGAGVRVVGRFDALGGAWALPVGRAPYT
jgi:hypothetical protein